jgi:hypothetical protein
MDFDRQVVDAAAQYLSDEEPLVGCLYSGGRQATLPHKKLEDSKGWYVRGDRFSLIVEPGMRSNPSDPEGDPIQVGVPYGSRARLILIYLQSETLRTGKPRC